MAERGTYVLVEFAIARAKRIVIATIPIAEWKEIAHIGAPQNQVPKD